MNSECQIAGHTYRETTRSGAHPDTNLVILECVRCHRHKRMSREKWTTKQLNMLTALVGLGGHCIIDGLDQHPEGHQICQRR
jgi:hypothetical protein